MDNKIMMSNVEIEFFKKHLDSSKVVLEYGCGKSTLEYSKLVKTYVSIENEEKWYRVINKQASSNTFLYLESPKESSYEFVKYLDELEKNAESLLSCRYFDKHTMSGYNPVWNEASSSLFHKDERDKYEWHTLNNYVNKPIQLIDEYGKFDIVLVDGVAREFCTYRAKDLIKDDGLIFFHDFKRTQYHGVLNFYEIVEQVNTLALLRLK